MNRSFCHNAQFLIGILVCMLLCACRSSEDDLTHYINNIKSRSARPISAIPDFKPLSKFTFPQDDKRRSPFQPIRTTSRIDLLAPNTQRPKQSLEAFPLDVLKFVGTLKEGRSVWALISQPGGLVTRVKKGDYMGRNYGQIVHIDEKEIQLEESVQPAGRWKKKMMIIDLRAPK